MCLHVCFLQYGGLIVFLFSHLNTIRSQWTIQFQHIYYYLISHLMVLFGFCLPVCLLLACYIFRMVHLVIAVSRSSCTPCHISSIWCLHANCIIVGVLSLCQWIALEFP